MASNAPTSICRNVRITAESRPAESHAPVFQFPGPWFTCESKPPFWRTWNTPPDAGQASGPPTALPGMETWTIARSVAATNCASVETRNIPRTESVAPTMKRGVTARTV